MIRATEIFDDLNFDLIEYTDVLLENKMPKSEEKQQLGKLFYALIAAAQENAESYLLSSDKATLNNREDFLLNNRNLQYIIDLVNNYINSNNPQDISKLEEILNNEREQEKLENEQIAKLNKSNKIDLSHYTRNSKSGFSYHKLFIVHKDLILNLAAQYDNNPESVIKILSEGYNLPIYRDFGDNAVHIFKRQSNWSFKDENPFSRKNK